MSFSDFFSKYSCSLYAIKAGDKKIIVTTKFAILKGLKTSVTFCQPATKDGAAIKKPIIDRIMTILNKNTQMVANTLKIFDNFLYVF